MIEKEKEYLFLNNVRKFDDEVGGDQLRLSPGFF